MKRGNWPQVEEESARCHTVGGTACQGRVWSPPGVLACKSGGCSHLHPPALQLEYSCLQGADPTAESLPMLRRRDSQAHQVPVKKGWSDRAGSTPPSALSPCVWTGEGPEPGQALHIGRGSGFLRLTGQSWQPQPPGSRSQLQRSCPYSGPGPGPPATRPRSQRRGRWRRHGPPAGWEAWRQTTVVR